MNEEIVNVPINRTLPGIFEYRIEFQDDEYYYGSYEDVLVTIQDLAPYTNNPSDFTTEQSENDMIEWKIYDDFWNGQFRILANDTNNNNYTWMDWNSYVRGSSIRVPINRIALGTFKYIIEFNTSSGEYAEDFVVITIVEDSSSKDTQSTEDNKIEDMDTFFMILLILITTTIILGIVSLLLLLKYRSLSKNFNSRLINLEKNLTDVKMDKKVQGVSKPSKNQKTSTDSEKNEKVESNLPNKR